MYMYRILLTSDLRLATEPTQLRRYACAHNLRVVLLSVLDVQQSSIRHSDVIGYHDGEPVTPYGVLFLNIGFCCDKTISLPL